MRTVLVANPKGGSGKTTLATNLAAYLANRNEKVALWDLDRQGSSIGWLEMRAEQLPRISSFQPGAKMSETDWLVLDSPAGLHGKNLSRLVKLARMVVVPVQPSLFDMEATKTFMQQILEEKAVRKHHAEIALIGMRVDARTRAAARLEEFLAEFDLPVLTHLRNAQAYVNTSFEGQSLFDLPQGQVRRDLEQWQPLLAWIEKTGQKPRLSRNG